VDYSALSTEVDAKQLRRAQYNGLPKVFQNEIEDQRIKWRTLSDSEWWHNELVSIERKEQRDLLEEKAKKRKSAEGTKNPGGKGGSSTNKKAKTSLKKGGPPDRSNNNQRETAGEMKFCPLCHGAGLPERTYCSHNLVKCDKKDLFNQALTAAVKPKPPPGAGRGRGRGLSQMEHNQRERVHHSFEEATTHEQIHRAF
jgi:hypothetical protein